jgi:8-oxo-dGTP diphosphatase
VPEPKGPSPTVDVVILLPGDRVVLVRRRYPPPGWALPGGFVDQGETLEAAAVREAREETGLEVRLEDLLYVYSDPRRDPRRHTVSAVFLGRADGEPKGADDAEEARAFDWTALPAPLAFDHAEILADARRFLLTGARRRP